MNNTFPLTEDQVRDLSTNILEDLEGAFSPLRGGGATLKTWRDLDAMLPYGGIPLGIGHIVYILGRSNHGKSYLAMNLIGHAIDMKMKTLVISLEMCKSQLYGRLVQMYSGLSFKEVIGGVRGDPDYLKRVAKTFESKGVHKYLKFVFNLSVPEHVESLVDAVRPDLLVLDYIQIGPHTEKSKLDSIDRLCRQFVTIKSKYKTTILALTQASRVVSADKNPKRYWCVPPDVDECKGSSEIENSADIILSIARPGGWLDCAEIDRNKMIVYGAKFRDQPDPSLVVKPILLKINKDGLLTDW